MENITGYRRFDYANPLTIFTGIGVTAKLAELLADNGVGTAHILTTKSLVDSRALGSLRSICSILAAANVSTVTSHGPIGEIHQAAIEIASTGAKAVIALGGGSVIDAAKLCAHAVGTGNVGEMSLEDFKRTLSVKASHGLPIYCLPTTLSAAELYGGAGFTDDETGQKDGASGGSMLPTAVFYDPDICDETPAHLWLSTGIRTIDHAIETILSSSVDSVSESLASSAVTDLFKALPAFAAGSSSSARLDCLVASWKSYHRPLDAATGLSHTIGKAVGAKNGIPHGITSCVILPRVLRYLHGNDKTRASVQRLSELIGLGPNDGANCVVADKLERFVADLGLPTHFDVSQLPADAIKTAADRVAHQKGLPALDIATILRACVGGVQ